MPCDRATVSDSMFILRLRRIRRALDDLGIAPVVGATWVASTDDGIGFADLDAVVSDRLARVLEDIVQRLGDAQRESSWFFARASRGLFTPTELRGPVKDDRFRIHPEVPR